jgi:hypothetical protein
MAAVAAASSAVAAVRAAAWVSMAVAWGLAAPVAASTLPAAALAASVAAATLSIMMSNNRKQPSVMSWQDCNLGRAPERPRMPHKPMKQFRSLSFDL